jgi:hypothetical protein
VFDSDIFDLKFFSSEHGVQFTVLDMENTLSLFIDSIYADAGKPRTANEPAFPELKPLFSPNIYTSSWVQNMARRKRNKVSHAILRICKGHVGLYHDIIGNAGYSKHTLDIANKFRQQKKEYRQFPVLNNTYTEMNLLNELKGRLLNIQPLVTNAGTQLLLQELHGAKDLTTVNSVLGSFGERKSKSRQIAQPQLKDPILTNVKRSSRKRLRLEI